MSCPGVYNNYRETAPQKDSGKIEMRGSSSSSQLYREITRGSKKQKDQQTCSWSKTIYWNRRQGIQRLNSSLDDLHIQHEGQKYWKQMCNQHPPPQASSEGGFRTRAHICLPQVFKENSSRLSEHSHRQLLYSYFQENPEIPEWSLKASTGASRQDENQKRTLSLVWQMGKQVMLTASGGCSPRRSLGWGTCYWDY